MSWDKELEELRHRERLAEQMGGEEKVARQHSRGKMDARARLAALVDPGSFREIGKIAGKASYDEDGNLEHILPAPFLFGKAEINGRPVVATADDFTIRGGAADAGISRKMVQAEKMAHELKLPSHYSIMVKGLSQLFAAGPAVVDGLGDSYRGSTDHQQAKEDLGGSAIHTRNGVVDDEVGSEAEAFARARHFLSFMPEHVGQLARRTDCSDPVRRRDHTLDSLVPRDPKQVYSMRRCLDMVFDQGTVFEIGRMWGRACITALARLDGWPVMVLASDPSYLGGSWEAKTSEKVERFVKLADQFRLPIVHLVDNPGFMIGREAEMAGTIRYGVQAMTAIYKASVPLASVVLRRAYGIAGSAMSNAENFQYRYCWPSGDWGSLPIAGGLEVAYKSDLEAADDPAAELEAIRGRLDKVTSPFRSAERFNVEDIIAPRDTRPLLCEFADLAWRKLYAEA